jgi:hypothetical protein
MDRLSNSLCRSPFVWLTATILAMLLMNHGLTRIAEQPGHGSTGLALVGVAGAVFGTGIWLWVQSDRPRHDLPKPVLVTMRWLFATIPFEFAWVTIAAGGEQWVFSIGFITSVVLLVISARRTRREEVGESIRQDEETTP